MNIKKEQPDRAQVSLNIRRMVLMGILFAAVLVLTVVEDALQLPVPAPGVKLGLSNIIVMYSLFFLGKREAVVLAVLKAAFVLLTRGAVASFLSLCGGLLSVAVMIVLMLIFRDGISYLLLSIAGSIFHNFGQLAAVTLVYTSFSFLYYLPALLICGVIAGAATSVLLKLSLPALKKLGLQ